LAGTIGRALPNRHQLLVERGGLVRWLISGVRTMRELEQFLNTEAEWVLERLSTGTEANDRNYYQGRLDQLAQVRRYLGQPQIMRERAQDDRTPLYY
jgi:hypothetical protein